MVCPNRAGVEASAPTRAAYGYVYTRLGNSLRSTFSTISQCLGRSSPLQKLKDPLRTRLPQGAACPCRRRGRRCFRWRQPQYTVKQIVHLFFLFLHNGLHPPQMDAGHSFPMEKRATHIDESYGEIKRTVLGMRT